MQSLINNWIRGVDTYTHNGSTWLIFTDSKRWVIELTEDKTLWYNYNFFKQIFSLTSLDVVENQQYITKWVEDNVMNKVKDTRLEINITEGEVDDIIQDGVKKIRKAYMKTDWSVEDTIENGVKETKISPTHTEYGDWLDGDERLGEIIKNGVKETQFNSYENKSWVEGVIKGGVKETKQKDRARLILDIDGRGLILETNLVIRDGVKETNHVDVMGFFDNKMEDTLQNGVKETNSWNDSIIGDLNQNGCIDNVIKNGVKETKVCNYIHPEMNSLQLKTSNEIDEVIQNGVKKTLKVENGTFTSIGFAGQCENVIENGVKVSGTFVGGKKQKENIESVIGYGTKNPTD